MQIEADRIYVEYAYIKKISGHDIIIGPGCEITAIDYTGSVEIHENSTVKKLTKL